MDICCIVKTRDDSFFRNVLEQIMRILLCGDIVGQPGRDVLEKYISIYRNDVDLIVANVDNVAHGFGITPTFASRLFDMGVDVLTGGNHITDKKEIFPMLVSDNRILKPENTSDKIPGNGFTCVTAKNGQSVLVIHLLGQKDMPFPGDNPFRCADRILKNYQLGQNVAAIVVDFHAETTSEKKAMGFFLDGRVSVVVGTHTHIPTSDYYILEHGTAYQTDLGMIGDYNSVIGMQKEICVERFVSGFSFSRLMPTQGPGTFFATLVTVDEKTGLAIDIQQIKGS